MKQIFIKLCLITIIILSALWGGIIARLPQFPLANAAGSAPTLVNYQQSNWTDGSTSEVTPTLTWSPGNLIICVGGTRDSAYTLNTPTASDLTFSSITSVSGKSLAYAWQATAGSSGSGAVTATTDGTPTLRGLGCFIFSGSNGVGNSAVIRDSSNPVVSLTRNADDSAVVTVMTDWNAISDTSPNSSPSGSVQQAAINVNNIYSAYVNSWGDQGPTGSASYGLTNYPGNPDMTGIAVEVLGVPNGGSSSAPTISSFTASPLSITSGQPSILSWSVSGSPTPTLSISGGGPVSGTSISVSPTQTTTYTLTATNSQGFIQANTTVTVTGQQPDTTPPSTPTNLSATAVSSSAINLAWSASADNIGVTGYKIFRNGSQVGTSATNSYSDTGLSASTQYTYTVSAYDAAGNNSAQSSPASATTQAAVTGINCDLATLQAAINAAARNATITCNAGTWTWAGTVTATKGVTLVGAGAGSTVIQNGTGDGTVLQIFPDSTAIANEETIKVTGFTFDGQGNGYALIAVAGSAYNGTEPFKNLIITGNTFQNTGSTSGAGNNCIAIQGQVRGVVYSNIFDRCEFPFRTFGADDTREWSNTAYNNFSYGSADDLYFEDNTIQYSTAFNSSEQAAGWIESGQGGRWVVRFNTWNMKNATGQSEFWDIHGFQNFLGGGINGQTGTMISEFYDNTIINGASSVYRWIYFRGGWGMFFDNSYSGASNPAIGVNQYAIPPDVSAGCYPYVKNPDGSAYTGPDGTLANTYFINNTVNGILTNATYDNTTNGCGVVENGALSPYGTGVVYGWWNQQSSFNGMVGIGRGPIAARPSTCATGVGYWATDQGSWNTKLAPNTSGQFYKCTSTNVWVLYYTPYTYPDPLRTGGSDTTPPAPPTGVSVN